jgi:hypothetical protein
MIEPLLLASIIFGSADARPSTCEHHEPGRAQVAYVGCPGVVRGLHSGDAIFLVRLSCCGLALTLLYLCCLNSHELHPPHSGETPVFAARSSGAHDSAPDPDAPSAHRALDSRTKEPSIHGRLFDHS